MIKVRILQNVGAGFAGAAALVGAGTGTVGCTAQPVDGAESQESADTAITPAGTGVFSLHSFSYDYKSTSGGDEFIRAGESLKATISLSEAAYLLSLRGDYKASERIGNDPDKVVASLKVIYKYSNNQQISQVSVPVTWAADSSGAIVGTTNAFIVPAGAPRMSIAFVLSEVGGTAIAVDEFVGNATYPVMGAFMPNKLALFDNTGNGQLRTRIVEGGALTPGKDVTISYTDFRADQAVDKYKLDTTIGDGRSYSRFGPTQVQIQGQLNYEVGVVYSTDNGQTWKDGGLLEKHTSPDVLGTNQSWRSSFEKTFRLPTDATGLRVAFHVKAVLVADPHYQYVEHWKNGYQLGASYVLRDTWDNNNGADYNLAVAN